MRKRFKKFVAIALTGLMVMSIGTPAFANTNELNSNDFVALLQDSEKLEEREQYAIANNEINLTEAQRYGDIFDEAYANGDVVVDNDGKLQVNDSLKEKLDSETFQIFKTDMQTMNYCLEIGAYTFNQVTGDFEAVPINLYLQIIMTFRQCQQRQHF